MYAITDHEGFLVDVVEGTARQAVRTARLMGAQEVVYDDSWDYLEVHPKLELRAVGNPPPSGRDLDKLNPAKAPEAARKAAGDLFIDYDELRELGLDRAGLDEAHRLLFPYFEHLRLTRSGELPKHWTTSLGMAQNLLRQNFKTEKTHPTGATDVQGLNLLPKTFWSKKLGGEQWLGRKVDFCIAASEWCEQACLVYSGRQTADIYNIDLKEATVDAMLAEPLAFGRMLYEACKLQQGNSRRIYGNKTIYNQLTGETSEMIPFVRLNVISDLPWELVFPSLFDKLLPKLAFYDYTKVPGRVLPLNYDLTFSWSGANFRSCIDVINGGGKVAVVFFKRRQKGGRWPTHEHWRGRVRGGPDAGPFPARFLGAEVIDGDITDVRPFDRRLARGRPPYIVALRYKAPRAQAFDPFNALFIVPCWEIEGEIVAVEVPRDTPGTLRAVLRDAEEQMREVAAEAGAPERPQTLVSVERLRRR